MFKKILLGIGVFAAIVAMVMFSTGFSIGKNFGFKPTGTVTIWGTLPSSVIEPIIQSYNAQAQTYGLVYTEVSENDFNSKLLEAIANNVPPDMILAPYQIILSQKSRLYPFPVSSLTEKSYKDSYVDGASIFWTPYGAMALPISFEPLVLFYNRTLLSKHGVTNPPTYWDEVTNMIPLLTVQDQNGGFLESAIALGTYNNVPYVKDILVSIINQLGQVPVLQQYTDKSVDYSVLINTPVNNQANVLPLTVAMSFFTQFSDRSKSTYTWNQFLPQAEDTFIAEKLAMYVGYSGDAKTISERNQKVDVGMTYLPQTRGYNTFTTGMRMYGLATLRQSKNADTALFTESTLSSGTWSQLIASSIGGLLPIKSAVSASGNEVLSKSSLVARGWFDLYYSSTNDLFERMINDILSGRYLINDAVDAFVSRFAKLYTPIK